MDFLYDTTSACGSCSSAPANQPAEVRVSYASTGGLDDPADTVDYLSFGYDSEGRLTHAQTWGPPAPEVPALMSEVNYQYDTMGNLTQETLDPNLASPPTHAKTVTYDWNWKDVDGDGVKERNRLDSITYPTGSRRFDYTYDSGNWYEQIGRMTGLALAGATPTPVIHYATTAGGRNIIQTWGDDKVELDYNLNDQNTDASLFDRFGRIKTMDIRKITNPASPTTIHKYEYGYDANGNRTYANVGQNAGAGALTDDRSYIYEYDRLNRLVKAGLGRIDLASSPPSFDSGLAPTVSQWKLDLLGNWSNTALPKYAYRTFVDTNFDGIYNDVSETTISGQHHGTDQSNRIGQYDAVDSSGATTSTEFLHDATGNLVLDDKNFYKYDAWNRIVAVHKNDDQGDLLSVDANGNLTGTPGTLVATYDYDALGRRIAKAVGGSPTEYFYYDGHRVIEHHTDDGTGVTLNKQHVYGLNYLDEPVAYYDADAMGVPGATPHFILQDVNYDVVGITDDQGTLVQQMTLDPYGNYVYIEDGTGAPYNGVDADVSALLIPLGRNGLRYDPETGLYYVRARYYDPVLGRWKQRDPNGAALLTAEAASRHSGRQRISVPLNIRAQYSDGLSLYQYVRSHPATGKDPLGLRDSKCEKNHCQGLNDMRNKLNKRINDKIAAGQASGDLEDTLWRELAAEGDPVFFNMIPSSNIENWLNEQDNVFSHGSWLSAGSFSPCIRIVCGGNTYCIGTDKIGHFFQVGYMMLEISRAKDSKHAYAFSRWTEGTHGAWQEITRKGRWLTPETIGWLKTGRFEFRGHDETRVREYGNIWGNRGASNWLLNRISDSLRRSGG